MSSQASLVNELTATLPTYPMEQLKVISAQIKAEGKKLYDFGTGDPRIPIWDRLLEVSRTSFAPISQYPSIYGTQQLRDAQRDYLRRRYDLAGNQEFATLPCKGSKEGIFHVALSIIGRSGKRRMIYPDPGYPVYRPSIAFAGGEPIPVSLKEKDGYLLKPWDLAKSQTKDVAAIWVNYPHNPSGACVDEKYWANLIDWCQQNDCLLLSDECYSDIYHPDFDLDGKKHLRPFSPLCITTQGVVSFMSLSKRSGLTGYRLGFMAGDSQFIAAHAKARANFGLGVPDFLQEVAVVAWGDDAHVAKRRQIFFDRLEFAGSYLKAKGLIDAIPTGAFYLWARVPKAYSGDDVRFCLDMAKQGVVLSPSSWLGENSPGYFRMAMVPELSDTKEALAIMDRLI